MAQAEEAAEKNTKVLKNGSSDKARCTTSKSMTTPLTNTHPLLHQPLDRAAAINRKHGIF